MIELKSGKFDPMTATWLARFCKAAYGTPIDQDAWCTTTGLPLAVSYHTEGTEAFLAADDHTAVLAWRGTTSITDWLTDAKVRQVPGPFGNGDKVHRGFDQYVSKIWELVNDALYVFDDRRIFITGHSLGGAAAEIATARLIAEKRQVAGCYTFGKPMTGNRSFSTIYDHRARDISHRVVYQNDMVARMPSLLGLVGKYRQTCRHSTQYLAHTGRRMVNPGLARVLWDRYRNIGRGVFKWASQSAVDHDIENYIHRLHLESAK